MKEAEHVHIVLVKHLTQDFEGICPSVTRYEEVSRCMVDGRSYLRNVFFVGLYLIKSFEFVVSSPK